MSTWKEWVDEIMKWAAENPWEFIYYVLLGLSPFFLASTILSWRLAKHIEAEERRKQKKSKKNANMAEIRRAKTVLLNLFVTMVQITFDNFTAVYQRAVVTENHKDKNGKERIHRVLRHQRRQRQARTGSEKRRRP